MDIFRNPDGAVPGQVNSLFFQQRREFFFPEPAVAVDMGNQAGAMVPFNQIRRNFIDRIRTKASAEGEHAHPAV